MPIFSSPPITITDLLHHSDPFDLFQNLVSFLQYIKKLIICLNSNMATYVLVMIQIIKFIDFYIFLAILATYLKVEDIAPQLDDIRHFVFENHWSVTLKLIFRCPNVTV